MVSVDPSQISIGHLHGYLLASVAPRPIAFASTVDEKGAHNLAPFSFFNVFSANPPIAVFSPARRGRDNTTKHTYENVLVVPEVVINIVTESMVQQCSLASTDYKEGISEFVKAGLTAVPSELVKPPRVGESPVQLECKVLEVKPLGTNGGAGNLVICEVLRIHIDDSVLDNSGKIDPLKMNQVGRCGGNYYVRTNAQSMFEVEKPISRLGIGIDQIPAEIRNSSVLTGNDLGKLGNVESLPDETEVNDFKLMELSEYFIDMENEPEMLELKLHEMAKVFLAKNDTLKAWKTLLSFNNG